MLDLAVPNVNQRKRIPMRAIRAVVKRIARQFDPDKIILFGSYAGGQPRPESDVDLLVILQSDLRRDKRQEAISMALRPRYFPMDILAYTPAEARACAADPDSFFSHILETGRVLYARQSN